MPWKVMYFRDYLIKILYPFHTIRSIIECVNFMGLSSSGKELLLALMILGQLPLNYTIIPRLVASTLNTRARSKASFYDQIKSLKEKGLIKVEGGFIKLSVSGLIIASKYIVLVRMIYTVPMTITLLLLLTVFRFWIPLWFLYLATFIAILHHICNLILIFMRPVEYNINGWLFMLIRIIPEILPVVLFFKYIFSKIINPMDVSVEAVDIITINKRKNGIRII